MSLFTDYDRAARARRHIRGHLACTLPLSEAIDQLVYLTDSRHRGRERYGYSDLCTDTLLLHVERLLAFVEQLGEHYASPMGPAKTAEHYQLVRLAEQLRQEFQPLKGRAPR